MGYRHPLSPRYLEVDRQGLVFNAWYLAYFDDALAGCFAAGGLPYPQLLAEGYDVSLVHTELDWTAGLAYGESAEIVVGVAAIGRTSFTLTFEVARDGRTLCRGRTVYVVVADDGSGKRELPPQLRELLTVMQDAGQEPPAA
jgi:acyl-CoA thioester hydrolase